MATRKTLSVVVIWLKKALGLVGRGIDAMWEQPRSTEQFQTDPEVPPALTETPPWWVAQSKDDQGKETTLDDVLPVPSCW